MKINDTNKNGVIDLADDIDEKHLMKLMKECDYKESQSITECELFKCIMKVENEFREEKCPKYGQAYCEIPFEPCCHYEGWTC